MNQYIHIIQRIQYDPTQYDIYSIDYDILCFTLVVATLSFNAKMDLANLECNLKTRDSQKWPRKR